ncbi:MAG: PGF-pre-PGF domain-containing protein [SAR202 cluster bacterium]|nr:PGF-pre-PGF domain-containing protein [SAR202 cluster bacterium]
MEQVFSDKLAAIVELMTQDKLTERLPLMSPGKLWTIPFETLAAKLPGVDPMHLDFWVKPQVGQGILPPASAEVSASEVVYTLPLAKHDEWALIVGSPAPFASVWAKFTRDLASVRINVRDLAGKPAGLPDLPPGRVANAFVQVDVTGAGPQDIAVAAMVVFVEKNWLDANDTHRWSVQLNRFDEQQSKWVPLSTKRTAEDADRIFYAVVVPGFSTLAISGSSALPGQTFHIADLTVTPARAMPGDTVAISANVTNTTGAAATFMADLWIDHSAEATKELQVGPGQTVSFSHQVTRPTGTYLVRLDRLTGQFRIGTPGESIATGLPATGGGAPTTGKLVGLIAVGSTLTLAGAVLLRRRK